MSPPIAQGNNMPIHRIELSRQKEIIAGNNSRVIKNVSDLIYLTGLLQLEIVNLSIGDVEQNGSVVDSIQPVNFVYPTSFRKESIQLSPDAHNLLADHITFVRTLGHNSSHSDPLFPDLLKDTRYNTYNLWGALKQYSMYWSYDRHREAVILSFCWNKFNSGVSVDKLIHEAHSFSRYASLKKTERLVKLGISRDCNVYEEKYKNAVKSSETLLRYHVTRPGKLQGYLSEFEKSLILLDKIDQKAVLGKANKKLIISGNKLILKDNTLSYEKISGYKVDLSSIKNKSKKRIFPI